MDIVRFFDENGDFLESHVYSPDDWCVGQRCGVTEHLCQTCTGCQIMQHEFNGGRTQVCTVRVMFEPTSNPMKDFELSWSEHGF